MFAVVSIHNDFANHGVIVRRHKVVAVNVGVDPDTRPTGRVPHGDASGRWCELERVLGIDTALHRMAFDHHLALGIGQFLSCSGHDLGFNDINAGDELGHRVFNLYPCVHLNEIELAVFIQKLKGAGAAVTHFFASRHTTLAYAFNQLAGNARRGRFFNDFLVTPLHGAVALAQVNGVFVVVGQNLNFNMPGIL